MTLVEIQSVQFEILQKIHAFCKEKGLRYSLGGGTLLGAVRHHGYIPWDDDIDIMLPRPDYEVLLKEINGKYSYLEVQNSYTDRHFPMSWTRIFDNRTLLISMNSVSGVFVDVFPIEGLPAPDKIGIYRKEVMKYKQRLWRTTRLHKRALLQQKKEHPLRGNFFVNNIKYAMSRLLYPNRNVIVKRMNDFLQTYSFETSLYAGAITGTYGEKEYMEADVFRSYTELPFEGEYFMCIKKYDAYLEKHYGNYMELPPEEKRVTHHKFKVYWKDDRKKI